MGANMFKKIEKNILFYPINKECAKYVDPPYPSSKHNIPQWYKDIPKYTNGDKGFKFLNSNNLTVKSCLPVIDSLTSGYTFVLHCDVQVHRDENGNAFFRWAYNQPGVPSPVIVRTKENNCAWDEIDGYDSLEFNWLPSWNVKTPNGYSSVFTHPINRVDLPFYTLGGVIDTDGWGVVGNHPFLLKKGWEGIIPKNTPIFQIIPFKRDNWKSEVNNELTDEYRKQINLRDSFLKDYYKKNIWNSKNYR
jgi:hypothetical protein